MTQLDYATPKALDPNALLRQTARPEAITLLLLIVAFIVGPILSPYFLDGQYLLDSTSLYMEVGIMALAMTFVIISGNIDLSVASNLALTAVICGRLYNGGAGLSMPIVLVCYPLLGTILGAFNGLLVAWLKLPSLTVTLGTLALYRGLAQVLAGDASYGGFPDWFVGLDYRYVGPLPLPLIIFLALAIVAAIVLHKTVLGRITYTIGLNEAAARYAGLRVDWTKLLLFALSGLTAGVGALMMTSRQYVADYKLGTGDSSELAVITAVVLGGTDIFGGRGSIVGTVLAVFLLGLLRTGMALANVTSDTQLIVTGSLLVVAVLLTRASGIFAAKLDKSA